MREIRDYLPEFSRQRYLKNPEGAAFSASLIIHEGRKHQVKLMLRAVNCRVCYLKRVAIDGIRLDENLGEGDYRPLNDAELEIIQEIKAGEPLRAIGAHAPGREAPTGNSRSRAGG